MTLIDGNELIALLESEFIKPVLTATQAKQQSNYNDIIDYVKKYVNLMEE